jgi:hypothetical protein
MILKAVKAWRTSSRYRKRGDPQTVQETASQQLDLEGFGAPVQGKPRRKRKATEQPKGRRPLKMPRKAVMTPPLKSISKEARREKTRNTERHVLNTGEGRASKHCDM